MTIFTTHNIYEYDRQNLVISYGIALLFTILSLCIGFWSLQYNGVAHSNSFSACLATTGNPDLHNIIQGNSLGALPLDKDTLGKKVRFGALVRTGETSVVWEEGQRVDEMSRIGFGPAEKVAGLVKGGRYI